jgi:hypothetical protein
MLQFLDVPRERRVKSAPPCRFPVNVSNEDDTLAERIKHIATQQFLTILAASADHQKSYKVVLTVEVDGEDKSLLIVGTAHSKFEDGSCVALLNPEEELVAKLSGGWGGHTAIFKEAVAKKCDMAIALWIDAYRRDGVTETARCVVCDHAPALFGISGIPPRAWSTRKCPN